MLNKVIALAIAAGFASASFAQPAVAPAPAAAPTAKVTSTTPAATTEKAEAAKAAEPVKAAADKGEAKPVKVKHSRHKAGKHVAKAETPAPEAK